MYHAKSISFLNDAFVREVSDEIHIHRIELEALLSRSDEEVLPHQPLPPSDNALIAILRNPQTNKEIIVCIGSPHFEERNCLYAPMWILNNIGCSWDGSDDVVLTLQTRPLPKATAIYIKPHDTMIYHTDIRECFENTLMDFHCLQEGTTLTFCAEGLGGYETSALIQKTEPYARVRLGGEVHVEFIEPDDGIPEFQKPPPIAAAAHAPVSGLALDEPTSPPSPPPLSPEEARRIREEQREAVRQSWLKRFQEWQTSDVSPPPHASK